jgi:predicted transcriptional regulator
MTNDRVTISLPSEVRAAAQAVAEETGQPFSALVSDALVAFVRGRMVDAWIAEYESAYGEISEDELIALSAETGIPYVSPQQSKSAA